jgi:predicted flavoprotein YhiN
MKPSAAPAGWGSTASTAACCALPGVFVAGEMLDWEAPTGGYLLTACLAQGRAAGEQAVAWLEEHS